MSIGTAASASLNAIRIGLLATVLVAATAAPAIAQNSPAPVPAVLGDGVNAKFGRVDGLHRVRYIEIFLATKDPTTGKLVAPCYNSSLRGSGVPDEKDTAPQALVAGLDFKKIAAEYGVLNASLNGPKLWMPDWAEVDVGKLREFNGIKTAWVAQLNLDKGGDVADSTPYKMMTIARNSGVGWNKGTKVLLLDDTDGNTWVMKGFQVGINPQHTYEQFVAAGQGNFKKLPPGWKFRVKTLDKDLVERPANGVASIMPDEFFNMYDKTGPGMTNYKP